MRELLRKAVGGEIGEAHASEIKTAEKMAINDQLHPIGSGFGLNWVSNGGQRKSGYTT